jgi:hypothetical protein
MVSVQCNLNRMRIYKINKNACSDRYWYQEMGEIHNL